MRLSGPKRPVASTCRAPGCCQVASQPLIIPSLSRLVVSTTAVTSVGTRAEFSSAKSFAMKRSDLSKWTKTFTASSSAIPNLVSSTLARCDSARRLEDDKTPRLAVPRPRAPQLIGAVLEEIGGPAPNLKVQSRLQDKVNEIRGWMAYQHSIV